MKNLISCILVLFCLIYTNAYGQSGNCNSKCNLINNPCFKPNKKPNKGDAKIFTSGNMPVWKRSHGSPHYNPSGVSIKGSLGIAASSSTKVNPKTNRSEGYAQSIPTMQVNKPYLVAINYKRGNDPKYGNDVFYVDFTDVLPDNGCPLSNGTGWDQIMPSNYSQLQNGLTQTALNNTWTLVSGCFTPTYPYEAIWIHNQLGLSMSSKGILNTLLDNVELIENFDFALNDTGVCMPGSPVYLRVKCDDFLNFTATYRWRDLNTGSVVGTSKNLTVTPMINTKYECRRILNGDTACAGYDTVTVKVGGPLITVDLGPDTSFCRPDSLVLDAGFHGPQYAYDWYMDFVPHWIGAGQTKTVYSTAHYIVQVTDTLIGCVFSDTILVEVFPDVKVYPDTLWVCDLSRAYTFDAGPGYVNYQWDFDISRDSQTFKTNVLGIHIVQVTDIHGCVGLDTGLLVLRTFEFHLKPDTIICEGDCIEIRPKLDDAFETFVWSTGANDTSITVCEAGMYWLNITDSLGCSYTDTMQVYMHSQPALALTNLGPICYGDTFMTPIIPMGTAGYFENQFVVGDTFFVGSGWAGPGIHKIYYHWLDNWVFMGLTSICPFKDSLTATVLALPTPQIDTLGPFCLSTPEVLLTANPAGGTFYDSTLTTITHFDPSLFGSGMHKIYYHYTDSAGCDAWDTMKVKVMPGPTIQFWKDTVFCIPAYGLAIGAHIDTTEWTDIKIYWSTGDTTARTRVYAGGWHKLTLYTPDSSCVVTDSFFIGDGSCCTLTPDLPGENLNFSNENPLTWEGITIVIDQDITIDSGHVGQINNCTIIMQNCSKIIVKRGAELEINDSRIGYCEWEGIEVWGHWDACSDDWTQQGQLRMTNTEINSANVGIMLGKRDYSAGAKFAQTFCGGVIDASNCHFKGNYTDVLITPWAWAAICSGCPSPGDVWHSKFTNCDFDTLADNAICYPFIDIVLDTLNGYFDWTGSGPPKFCHGSYGFWQDSGTDTVQSRCHIIDLSPYIDYWNTLPGSATTCGQLCPHNSWSVSDDITNPNFPYLNPNSYIGRTFSGSIINCISQKPHSKHD